MSFTPSIRGSSETTWFHPMWGMTLPTRGTTSPSNTPSPGVVPSALEPYMICMPMHMPRAGVPDSSFSLMSSL